MLKSAEMKIKLTTLLKSVEVPKLTDAHNKQKVQSVRNNLYRNFC